MGKLPESDKAVRYISQLDEARCNGRWSDVPELCRKVEKHANHRHCLTLTARSEARISAYSTQRPSTAASTSSSGLSSIIPSLLTAIEEEKDYAQDGFQATVCLAWLHYVLDEPGLAVARLPKDFAPIVAQLSSDTGALSGWTRVCIIKGVFLKGSSQDKTGATEEAIQTYSSILPWLASLPAASSESSLFKMWTERLLVRLCQLVDQSAETGGYIEPTEALQAFRFWAKFWDATGSGSGAAGMAGPRRSAWKAYYTTLSRMLHDGYPLGNKLQQRAELKRVETIYEGLLLKDTHFPKANESNKEIEEWADAVMDNWRVFLGPTWSDEDLGEGGKEAVGRNVLDILYRAATKTYHSTAILRHLFSVHTSLAEFDLAFRAYDSYVEIVNRGKDRAETSGEEDAGLDDDSVVLRTSAEAMRMLCRFGSRKEAEKAVEIGHHIEKWLDQIQHIKSAASDAGSVTAESSIANQALAQVYCAIGISQAQWARYTYNADARATIQAKAVQYLSKSLEPRYEDPNNIEALYALGLVLAEMRDIPGAIKVVKRALASPREQEATDDGFTPAALTTEFGRERKLIPVWHLLALLLTTRSDFSAAEKACEAAFEQFGDITDLFGNEENNDSYRSEHLNEANNKGSIEPSIVDGMETFEKSGILQIKMTQLALLEVVEGPDSAVDGCEELLALFTRLFGEYHVPDDSNLQPPATAVPPPKSAVGTIRGGIFRSNKGSVRSTHREPAGRNASVSTTATQTTTAPAIQVTDENGADHAKQHHHHHHLFHHHKHDEEKPGVTRSPSKLQKRSANSLRRKSAHEAQHEGREVEQPSETPEQLEKGTPNGSPQKSSSSRRRSMSSSLRKSMEGSDRRPRSSSLVLPHSREPSGLLAQSAHTGRLPAPVPGASYIAPDPLFPTIEYRRHKVTLLVDIWLFISGLYTRASMYEDAKGAVTEAFKLVQGFEAEVSVETSSSKAFADRGMGTGRSVEELWADAFTARGELSAAEGLNHEAKVEFERALLHFPDHPEAIVGLSNILLDIYAQVIPPEPDHQVEPTAPLSPPAVPVIESELHDPSKKEQHPKAHHTPSAENRLSPPVLNRLAARDRAFGLLSTLTKLGAGWDYSEAWYALARAYEESGQIEKTKEVLWWCVELEDTHPVRSWRNVALGGFVL